jgi:HSP20 family molecular chaperone IbpA
MDRQTHLTNRTEDRPETVARERLAVAPLVDVYENDAELLLVADVPGVAEGGVDVHLDKSELRLVARRADADRLEYRRAFVLPAAVDPDKVAAELANGVLRVHLPKRESAKRRTIAVRVA